MTSRKVTYLPKKADLATKAFNANYFVIIPPPPPWTPPLEDRWIFVLPAPLSKIIQVLARFFGTYRNHV